jgi:putative endonuclease
MPFVVRRQPNAGGLSVFASPQRAVPPLMEAKYGLRSSASAERRRAFPGCYRTLPPPLEAQRARFAKSNLSLANKTYIVYVVYLLPGAYAKRPPNCPMHFVYIIVSVAHPEHHYVGLTNNVRRRLGHHNEGIVRSTAPFKPWRLRSAICFTRRNRASEFEHYLKTGSGIAFLRKRLL